MKIENLAEKNGMERKMFYTLQQFKGVTGVRMEIGYELEIAGRKFYGYMSGDKTIYIIDPRSGCAIESRCYDFIDYDESTAKEVIEDEIRCIKYVAKSVADQGIIERLKKKEKEKSYQLSIKAFEAFIKAEKLLEKQRVEAMRETGRSGSI